MRLVMFAAVFASALLWYYPSVHAAPLAGSTAGAGSETADTASSPQLTATQGLVVVGPRSPIGRAPLDGDSDAADVSDDGDDDAGDRHRLALAGGDLADVFAGAAFDRRGPPAGSDGLDCAVGRAHTRILTQPAQRHRSAARRQRGSVSHASGGSRRDTDGGGDPDDPVDTSDQDDDLDDTGALRVKSRSHTRERFGSTFDGWRAHLRADAPPVVVIQTPARIPGLQVLRSRTRARVRRRARRLHSSAARQSSSDDGGGSASGPHTSRRLFHPLITRAGQASWSPAPRCIDDHHRGEAAVPPGIRVATCATVPGGSARCSVC